MCTSAILNLFYCDDGKTTASTSIPFRDNAHFSLIESKTIITNDHASCDQNFGISNHNFHCLVFAYDKRECELLNELSQKKGAKALHPNE